MLIDRELESAELFRAIVGRGFRPLMRVKARGSFCPGGWHKFYPLDTFAAREGRRFAAVGTAYRTAPLGYTLLACRAAGWLVLTDLPAACADPCWYALRGWIEQGFRVIKGGWQWQWQRTRMGYADRAERLWVAVSVATLWLVEVDGLAELEPRAETVPPLGRLDRAPPAVPRRVGRHPRRVVVRESPRRTLPTRTLARSRSNTTDQRRRVPLTDDLSLKHPPRGETGCLNLHRATGRRNSLRV